MLVGCFPRFSRRRLFVDKDESLCVCVCVLNILPAFFAGYACLCFVFFLLLCVASLPSFGGLCLCCIEISIGLQVSQNYFVRGIEFIVPCHVFFMPTTKACKLGVLYSFFLCFLLVQSSSSSPSSPSSALSVITLKKSFDDAAVAVAVATTITTNRNCHRYCTHNLNTKL